MPKNIHSDLFFHIYPLTENSYDELHQLVRTTTYSPFYSIDANASLLAQALECSREEVEKEAEPYETVSKYEQGGYLALINVFKAFKEIYSTSRGVYNDSFRWYLACLSNKELSPSFSFLRDARHVEMVVCVLTDTLSDHVIHLGIQRSILYALAGNLCHSNISMSLHACAAEYIMKNNPQVKLMVTNPLMSMEKIFRASIPAENIYRVKYLKNLREELGIDLFPAARRPINTYLIQELTEASSYICIPLDRLAACNTLGIKLPESCDAEEPWDDVDSVDYIEQQNLLSVEEEAKSYQTSNPQRFWSSSSVDIKPSLREPKPPCYECAIS